MDSILTSIKKLLGITEEYTHFDGDITVHINTAFNTLTQLGVGPVEGYSIKDKNDKWTDFVSDARLEAIKTYVYLKVKLLFDPPLTSSVLQAYERQLDELVWRINVTVDP